MGCIYSLRNINLSYPITGVEFEAHSAGPVRALIDVNLEIFENEYAAIWGPNGSGKSSLGKLLAGIAGKFTGELQYRSQKVEDYRRQIFNDVAMVIQEPQNQILMPTVFEELAMPLRNRKIADDIMEEKIRETAGLFGLQDLLDCNPEQLSGGQLTSLAIASSVITDPDVIIFDEPDSHLDMQAKAILANFIEEARGPKTIILITQYADFAREADRLIILKKGRVSKIGKLADLSEELRPAEFGMSGVAQVRVSRPGQIAMAKNDIILNLVNVSFAFDKRSKAIDNVSLAIMAGEKVGLVGPSGSGKTTLGLLMAGLLKTSSGDIYCRGESLAHWAALALRQFITMAMQLPERALFEETVQDDIAFGPRNIARENIHEVVDSKLTQFNIAHLKARHPFTLSGGEKRKAALAGILAMDTPVIIFDEPSAGLDFRSTGELVSILNSYIEKTLIIISHDLQFIKATCNRVISLSEGRIAADEPSAKFFENS